MITQQQLSKLRQAVDRLRLAQVNISWSGGCRPEEISDTEAEYREALRAYEEVLAELSKLDGNFKQ